MQTACVRIISHSVIEMTSLRVHSNSEACVNCVSVAQAFPAQNPVDRTTYMFTYLDADERRPSLAALMELYWRTMPAYQALAREFAPAEMPPQFLLRSGPSFWPHRQPVMSHLTPVPALGGWISLVRTSRSRG